MRSTLLMFERPGSALGIDPLEGSSGTLYDGIAWCHDLAGIYRVLAEQRPDISVVVIDDAKDSPGRQVAEALDRMDLPHITVNLRGGHIFAHRIPTRVMARHKAPLSPRSTLSLAARLDALLVTVHAGRLRDRGLRPDLAPRPRSRA